MTKHNDNEFFEAVSNLGEQLAGFADDNMPYFESITNDIIDGRMTDLNTIGRNLDTFASYCFNDKILARVSQLAIAIPVTCMKRTGFRHKRCIIQTQNALIKVLQ